MKKTFVCILILICCVLTSCVIETPEQHFNEPKKGEPTGKYAVMSVDCAVLLSHPDKVSAALAPFIPSDGFIIKGQRLEIMQNDNAIKFLTDALRENKILYSASMSYIAAINNITEKDFGAESGWVFIVNGKFSAVGAASYYVRENDVIEWRYSVFRGDLNVEVGDVYE